MHTGPQRAWLGLAAAVLCSSAALAQPRARAIGADGIIRAKHDLTIGSTREGKIERILVKEGDRVSRGDVILELDGEVYALNLALAELQFDSEVDLLRAKANLKKAELDVKRNMDLFKQKIVSETEMEVYRLNHEIARINLEAEDERRKQQKLNVQMREKELEDTRIRSPIDGVVVKLMFDLGEVVDELRPVARVVDVQNLQAHVHLPVEALGAVALGGLAVVIAEQRPDEQLKGKIAFIEPVVDPRSRTFSVKVDLEDAGAWLKPGLVAKVRFPARPAAGPER